MKNQDFATMAEHKSCLPLNTIIKIEPDISSEKVENEEYDFEDGVENNQDNDQSEHDEKMNQVKDYKHGENNLELTLRKMKLSLNKEYLEVNHREADDIMQCENSLEFTLQKIKSSIKKENLKMDQEADGCITGDFEFSTQKILSMKTQHLEDNQDAEEYEHCENNSEIILRKQLSLVKENLKTNDDTKNCLYIETEVQFRCDCCGKDFDYLGGVTGETYECKDCLKKSQYVASSKENGKTSQYRCEYCGKVFTQRGNLKSHIQLHTGELPYECQHCGLTFSNVSNMRRHLLLSSKKAQCKHCGEKFQQRCKFRRHLVICTCKRMPYECEHCGKKFRDAGNLKVHLRIHTGEKPFECNYCAKKFNQKCNWKTHLRIHTGEKPFVCEKCGKNFSDMSGLKKHSMMHTKEMRFETDQDQETVEEESKSERFKTETDNNLFECECCGKYFKRNGNLKKHLKILHSVEKPHNCEKCGKTFKNNNKLTIHLRLHKKKERSKSNMKIEK